MSHTSASDCQALLLLLLLVLWVCRRTRAHWTCSRMCTSKRAARTSALAATRAGMAVGRPFCWSKVGTHSETCRVQLARAPVWHLGFYMQAVCQGSWQGSSSSTPDLGSFIPCPSTAFLGHSVTCDVCPPNSRHHACRAPLPAARSVWPVVHSMHHSRLLHDPYPPAQHTRTKWP